MFTIFGQRFHKHEPFVDPKTKEIFDAGEPVKLKLGEFSDKKIADSFAANVKVNGLRKWKIWIEEI